MLNYRNAHSLSGPTASSEDNKPNGRSFPEQHVLPHPVQPPGLQLPLSRSTVAMPCQTDLKPERKCAQNVGNHGLVPLQDILLHPGQPPDIPDLASAQLVKLEIETDSIRISNFACLQLSTCKRQ